MITKNYIKMCEKNEDLQREWKPKIGDKYYSIEKLDVFIVTKEIRKYYLDKIYDKIYLPTQEQLWEEIEELLFGEKCELNIIIRNKECLITAWQILEGMSCIDEAVDTYTITYEIKGKDIKECFLKLIMKINWNKVWTGEKWVKAE